MTRQTAVGGDAARRFFIKQNDVGPDEFSQENCCPLACLEFPCAGEYDAGGRFGGNPRWQMRCPIPPRFRSIFMKQFGNHGMRHGHSKEKRRQDVNLTDQDEIAKR